MEGTRGAGFDLAFLREAQRINSETMRALRKEAGRTADPDIRTLIDRFLEMDAKHEAAGSALSENVLASKPPVIQPPQTGDDAMAVVPPSSVNSMPVIVAPPGDGDPK